MIRPFTLVCMLMAGASGLYLYQSKHRAQMLDRDIGKTIRQTEQARERIGMLKAEWALLNEPDRLADLARAHLGLRTLQPTQFAAVADLAARLPAPVAPTAPKPPTDIEPEEAPAPAIAPAIAQAAPLPAPALTPAPKLVPPRPAPVVLAATAPASPKPAPESKPARTLAEAKVAPAQLHPAPVQLAAAPAPRVPMFAPATQISVSSTATAPGTVGEAVLRAMRANAPAPHAAYVQPIVAAPVMAAPAYATTSYATTSYAAPAGSLLGGTRNSLPPPVPFAAR